MLNRFFRIIFCISVCLGSYFSNAQDVVYAHKIVDTLCSETMFGRACNRKGDSIAADFIANEFKNNNVLSFTPNYKQYYSLKCNEILNVSCFLNTKDSCLLPGEDYVVLGASPSSNLLFEKGKIIQFKEVEKWKKFNKSKLQNRIIVFDAKHFSLLMIAREVLKELTTQGIEPSLIILQNAGKLTFNAGRSEMKFPVLILKDELIKTNNIDYLKLDILSKFHANYKTQNVVGYVKGKEYADSFFVFTAHYDHLGGMGDIYFPGANDNASSVALLLDLARYYAKPENQPQYSILFVSTSGEELGLLGAENYAKNSDIPLSSIKFLINMDMNGTGSGGYHLVHGLVEKQASALMEEINIKNRYFTQIANGGEASNSDHYPFYKRSVPCLFVFTSGCEYNEYHSIYDVPEKLPFTKYQSVFNLLTDFIEQYR